MKPTPDPAICKAVRDRHVVEFVYHNKFRRGNPQCYGLTQTGKPGLRVHLIEGGSKEEQLFVMDGMKDFKILPDHFNRPGPNYSKGDSAFKEIWQDLE